MCLTDAMPTRALPRLKASLVFGVIFLSVLALAETHAGAAFEGIFRRRSQNDRLPKVAAKSVVNTAVDVLARLDKNIRSVEDERMRKVWQKGSLKPGNRRQQGGTPNTCDGALEAMTLLDRCVV